MPHHRIERREGRKKEDERKEERNERAIVSHEHILFLLLGSSFQRAEFTFYSSLYSSSSLPQPTLQPTWTLPRNVWHSPLYIVHFNKYLLTGEQTCKEITTRPLPLGFVLLKTIFLLHYAVYTGRLRSLDDLHETFILNTLQSTAHIHWCLINGFLFVILHGISQFTKYLHIPCFISSLVTSNPYFSTSVLSIAIHCIEEENKGQTL